MTARRLSSLAIAAGVLAAAAVLVPGDDTGTDDSGGESDWIFGLLLILAPLVCAAITRSVAASTLLRPIGAVATVMATLAAIVHVAVLVDTHGSGGWLLGVPVVISVVLMAAAVIRGRDLRTSEPARHRPPSGDAPAIPSGPPLDVVTPLRDARSATSRFLLAWFVATLITGVVAAPVQRLFGWPEVAERLEARVVDLGPSEDGTAITFAARHGNETLRWSVVAENPRWEVGDKRTVWLDEDGRIHFDQQFGLAGTPLVMPLAMMAGFSLFVLRRLWGLWVAWWDVHRTGDEPRLGFAAVIHDPAPRTVRPLLAIWWRDPTRAGEDRLPRPDAVYRADDMTASDLESYVSEIAVRVAWVDTGPWPKAKPRWVGFDEAVAVPHRRVVFGPTYIRMVTRKSKVEGPESLHHGPPNLAMVMGAVNEPARRPLRRMVAWRLVAGVVCIGLAFVNVDGGDRVTATPLAAD